ncbi:PAS domain-containing hybrid sensor histidine kinase/response regulator [Sphingomonas sp. SRS2]|uniref:PAS domain-containing hybrid sensor histidine kinase/response regulator n=1 Tax=Sphingomonas sp. SRS2 TaxID=133190 RepID=UPI0006184551|nr:PAS domain-containing hybrid sensor histidine kinase/response regulator [Sphingomonas sp. SRS2]KKC27558.1 histidine kinase [Sphingomonas sp. SRS2]
MNLAESLAGFGHWRSDRSTGTYSWSPQIYQMIGLSTELTPTRELMLAMIHPDDVDKIVVAVNDATRDGTLAPVRIRWNRPDGKTVHILVAGQMDGPTAMIGIMRDITEEVETERSLIAARDQARAAERAKAELLSVMSHEIRTPMNGLLNSVEALRRNPDEAQRRPLLDTLNQAASSVMSVVDDMLDYSRVESGRVVIESVNFDLKAAIRTMGHLFDSMAEAKGLTLDVHGLDGEPVIVCGDSARLQQLLSNLVSNAIKFTEAGSVSIGLSPTRSDDDADYWMVIIRDSGRGIGQETLGRIFARGDQVDAARMRLQGGTGLGLAISQQLAEAMGGSIAVSSDPGKGTTFSVELPFKRADGPAALAEEVPTGPMRILLAEDNPINRRLMAGLLTREGHQVIAVEDGRKALGAIAIEPFDLVLMDMQMPELDGISATRSIRALDPPACDTPILAISADSQPERRRIYFEAGIDSFLAKPIVSGQLLDMIATMRRTKRAPADTGGDKFNRERLNLLVEQGGYDDAAILMKMLLFDVSDRPQRIAASVRAQAWELAAAEAEALRTLLDSFGSFSLSRLLAAIARQCARRECQPAVLEELFEQSRALALVLNGEFGAVPSPIAQAMDNVVEPDFLRGSR